ncbi:MAG: Imm1 family immunity protein [Hyphomicrobiaceae bacterium]
MKKHAYFHTFWGDEWPTLEFLEPYFTHPAKDFGWFPNSSNDSAGISLQGLDGTEHLPWGRGRIDINLLMWGHPEHGVLLIYERVGRDDPYGYCSKGDMSRLREWVRSLHDTPLPGGLFIPFAEAWKAVKEFIETEGQLPTSIEWIKSEDLPEGTFPDP